jgi:hypothetical protein
VSAMLTITRAEQLEAGTRSLAAEFLVTLCEARDKVCVAVAGVGEGDGRFRRSHGSDPEVTLFGSGASDGVLGCMHRRGGVQLILMRARNLLTHSFLHNALAHIGCRRLA